MRRLELLVRAALVAALTGDLLLRDDSILSEKRAQLLIYEAVLVCLDDLGAENQTQL